MPMRPAPSPAITAHRFSSPRGICGDWGCSRASLPTQWNRSWSSVKRERLPFARSGFTHRPIHARLAAAFASTLICLAYIRHSAFVQSRPIRAGGSRCLSASTARCPSTSESSSANGRDRPIEAYPIRARGLRLGQPFSCLTASPASRRQAPAHAVEAFLEDTSSGRGTRSSFSHSRSP